MVCGPSLPHNHYRFSEQLECLSAKFRLNIRDNGIMLKLTFFLTFIFGILFSIVLHKLSIYLTTDSVRYVPPDTKVFTLIPFESSVHNDILDIAPRPSDVEPSYSEGEAVASLQIALEVWKSGRLDKAKKLFEHAVTLAPKCPDILTYYGEFLEESQNDILAADQLYFKALVQSPNHRRAITNRQRTASLVEEIDRTTLRRIDKKRDHVASIPDSDPALQKAKKESYFQHIYHTVGIEGNSMTLSQTRSIVETRMAIGGKSIAEHNEILGLDAALKYINATLIKRLGKISIDDILEIHQRVLGFVDPIESGAFRRTQVFVGGHIPPTPHHIPPLMEEFAEWLNSDQALRMHPVRYAALAHYKLVHIHPFTDGNGRTSRLLMNMILMQAGYPPVIIPKQERHKYYQMLELANEGDIRPFIRFIAECTEQTLNLFIWATTEFGTTVPALDVDVKTIMGSWVI
ncbi:unnamed protein product [Bemisia tabaci]|uniref:Protein adenylyltransferase Fic n=1 Tax=Bemisia tabaci TaxID=7038 RepID=A0A9P0CDK4_BEMTA|nr:unnamed protein product [Bemisia tabaci]